MDPGIDYFYMTALEPVELRELENAYNLYINNRITFWNVIASGKLCWTKELVSPQT